MKWSYGWRPSVAGAILGLVIAGAVVACESAGPGTTPDRPVYYQCVDR